MYLWINKRYSVTTYPETCFLQLAIPEGSVKPMPLPGHGSKGDAKSTDAGPSTLKLRAVSDFDCC